MKKLLSIMLLSILCLITCILPAKASADLGKAFLYDPASKVLSPALTQDTGKLSSLFGKKGFDLDLVSIFSSTPEGAPVLGYAALARYKVAEQLSIRFGPALLSRQSEKLSGSFFFSFELQF
jgi:hypothetical protein